jgi:hypothetical protein
VDQEPPPRERLGRFISEALVSDWRPSRDQWLWALRVVLVLVLLLGVLTLVGSPFGVTLWNWLDLLIVPVVLAVGGYLFSRSERQATEAACRRAARAGRGVASIPGSDVEHAGSQPRPAIAVQGTPGGQLEFRGPGANALGAAKTRRTS